jgi:hypothetical protein
MPLKFDHLDLAESPCGEIRPTLARPREPSFRTLGVNTLGVNVGRSLSLFARRAVEGRPTRSDRRDPTDVDAK